MKQHEHELVHELLEENQRLIDLLDRVEWVQPMSNSSPSCSCCGHMKHWGHADDCELALTIGVPTGKPVPEELIP